MEGNLNGQGKYTNSDVDTYEGEIKNNEYNGEGKLCNSKNRCISRGVFENGQLKRGTHYVWNDDGTYMKFDVNGNIIVEVSVDIEDKLKIVTDIVTELQRKINI